MDLESKVYDILKE